MCIGYHSRPGEKGILSHTIRGSRVVQHFYINDKASSEFEINAGIAGYYNVPIGLIAGDSDIVNDAKNLIPNIIRAPVKETINKFSAKNLSGNETFKLIKIRATECVQNYKASNQQPAYHRPSLSFLSFEHNLSLDYRKILEHVDLDF